MLVPVCVVPCASILNYALQHRFDATEDALDAMHAEAELNTIETVEAKDSKEPLSPAHKALYDLAERQVKTAMDVFQLGDGVVWDVVSTSADVTVYRRMVDKVGGDGVIEYLRTEATFTGITSKEICTYFLDIRHRQDWEGLSFYPCARAAAALSLAAAVVVVVAMDSNRDTFLNGHHAIIPSCHNSPFQNMAGR